MYTAWRSEIGAIWLASVILNNTVYGTRAASCYVRTSLPMNIIKFHMNIINYPYNEFHYYTYIQAIVWVLHMAMRNKDSHFLTAGEWS